MNTMDARLNDPLTEQIIGLAMKVHRVLGVGFLESVYRKALLIELRKAGLRAEEEKRINVLYEGVSVGDFAADILVEDKVILELKAVEALIKAHEVQTVNYLTATGLDVGLLINFGSERLQFKRKFRQRKGAGQDESSTHADNPVHPVKLSGQDYRMNMKA
jgi:GxxExxY protein